MATSSWTSRSSPTRRALPRGATSSASPCRRRASSSRRTWRCRTWWSGRTCACPSGSATTPILSRATAARAATRWRWPPWAKTTCARPSACASRSPPAAAWAKTPGRSRSRPSSPRSWPSACSCPRGRAAWAASLPTTGGLRGPLWSCPRPCRSAWTLAPPTPSAPWRSTATTAPSSSRTPCTCTSTSCATRRPRRTCCASSSATRSSRPAAASPRRWRSLTATPSAR